MAPRPLLFLLLALTLLASLKVSPTSAARPHRARSSGYGHLKLDGPAPEHVVTRPLPWERDEVVGSLPSHFDWRDVNGTFFATKILNQFNPKFCGSCWAFSSTSAMADRMKIKSRARTADILLSVQALLDCGNEHGIGGCDGGSAALAHKFMFTTGVTDDTCAPYMAVDYWNESELPCEETMCRQCDRFGTCRANPNATRHYASEFGNLPAYDVKAMMAEIYTRGPIVCGVYAHSQSFEEYKSGVISDPTKYSEITHDISLIGWGETSGGTPYWIGRNSFGTQWGMEGWFMIERGKNTLLVESQCSWAVPK